MGFPVAAPNIFAFLKGIEGLPGTVLRIYISGHQPNFRKLNWKSTLVPVIPALSSPR
jgi:hypothetical protein